MRGRCTARSRDFFVGQYYYELSGATAAPQSNPITISNHDRYKCIAPHGVHMAHETPRDVAWDIGRQYVDDLYPPSDDADRREARRVFQAMAERNRELFEQIPVPVVFTYDDPYRDFDHMDTAIRHDGYLAVFAGGDPHPIWDHTDELIGRAVHDWFGHLEIGAEFTAEGEYHVWKHVRDHYPAYCDRYLFTEIIGQQGASVYLDDGFASDEFEQKVFPTPPAWIERMSRAVESEDSSESESKE